MPEITFDLHDTDAPIRALVGYVVNIELKTANTGYPTDNVEIRAVDEPTGDIIVSEREDDETITNTTCAIPAALVSAIHVL